VKIYSGNSYATVTLTTGGGFIASVGHFFRGEPLYLEGGIKVAKVELSKTYDYFIGFCEYKKPTKVGIVDLDVGDTVFIRTDNRDIEVKIVEVLPLGKYYKYKFTPRAISKGDSGSPVIYDDMVVGYVTHEIAFNSIAPVLEAIYKWIKKLSKSSASSQF